jgi:predicted ATP-binding protein involved in virulence
MKIESLAVKGLYGYINCKIDFYSDVNFLIGINGSGKTSVLNTIGWILAPSLIKLAQVDYKSIEVVYNEAGRTSKKITADKEKGKVSLSIDGLKPKLEIPIFQYANDPALAERSSTNITEMYDRFFMENKNHPVLQELETQEAILFLPLNRRWEAPDRESRVRMRPRPRTWGAYTPSIRTGSAIESVLYLAERYYREQQFGVAQLSEKLREDIVEYSFSEIVSISHVKPTRKPWKVEEIRKRKETIWEGLLQAGIRISEEVVTKYFDSLENIATKLENISLDRKKMPIEYFEWEINMPQVEKIERVIQRMETFNNERNARLSRIQDFLKTINSFLCDTNKLVRFDTSGEIVIRLDEKHEIRADSLSSGESQLVILFTYLYFGFQPKRKFVVMIDEPELSLHLNWQHRYVESVIKANPDAQFIFATHAPEIAQGHDDRLIELFPKGHN